MKTLGELVEEVEDVEAWVGGRGRVKLREEMTWDFRPLKGKHELHIFLLKLGGRPDT